jgi:hypothetical protein
MLMLIFEDGHEEMPFQQCWSVSIFSHCSLFVQVCLRTEGNVTQSCKQRFLNIHNTKCKVRLSGFQFLYKSHPSCVHVCMHTYNHTKFKLWFIYRPHQSVMCTSYRLDVHGIAVWFLAGTKDFFLPQTFQARARRWSPNFPFNWPCPQNSSGVSS